ncbi:MAG: L-threonylcarbamoyladenylate synthase [Bacteroidales bacterium]|nr:L-threonylcarbamoyladenylate synthase [Bacteroidales bacterium]
MMIYKIHPLNPQERLIRKVCDHFLNDEIGIIPTDTVYAIACRLYDLKSIERIALLKGIDPEKANFSILVKNLSHLSEFARPISNEIFRIINKLVPGPYTFILNANHQVPKIFHRKKKSIGLRVPDHPIIQAILAELPCPLVSTSLKLNFDDIVYEEDAYPVDPDEIKKKYQKLVDFMIDAGEGKKIPSTVLDCRGDEIIVIREGLGPVDF